MINLLNDPITNKVNKSMGPRSKPQKLWPRRSLVTIYKPFIRMRIGYEGVIFDQDYNKSFHERFETFECNTWLAITAVIGGTSKEKLHQKLGFVFLQHRRWFCKLCTFYKVFINKFPCYLYGLLLLKLPLTTQDCLTIYPFFYIGHMFCQNFLFFFYNSWMRKPRFIHSKIWTSEHILQFIRPSSCSINNCFNTKGLGDFKLYFSV